MYRIDLPVDDKQLVKQVLAALAFRFSDDKVTVDECVHNPARLCKLYGSRVRKGDDVPDRPHRCSRILEVPDAVEIVPEEKLAALAESVPVKTNLSSSTGFNLENWITLY